MLRDLKDLVQGRTGPVDQADENLVPNAAGNGGQREQPGTAVQQEHHQDGHRRDHRPARAARPAKEWKQRSEGSQVDRLYGSSARGVERNVGRCLDEKGESRHGERTQRRRQQ